MTDTDEVKRLKYEVYEERMKFRDFLRIDNAHLFEKLLLASDAVHPDINRPDIALKAIRHAMNEINKKRNSL